MISQCCNTTVFIVFFFQASVVLGQFLVLKKNRELFQDWMKDVCGANTKQSSDCYQCLSDWCDEFLWIQMKPVLTFIVEYLV